MSRRGGTPQLTNSPILYIGQIPFEWDEENLKSVVCGSGNVLDVRLGFDHVGKNKGYAFVEYESPQQAHYASSLLGQVQIIHPGSRTAKRLRIELSKEGFRTGNYEHKPIIPFNPAYLPPTVQLPPEIMSKVSMGARPMDYQRNMMGDFSNPPLALLPAAPVNLAPQNQQKVQQMQRQQLQQQQQAQLLPGVQLPSLPEQYLRASSMLPQAPTLPFAAPDKINETLGSIPPTQLVELIANLKNILNGPQAARAGDVFRISPNLATAAAQALLLMGFIDEEVIQESMKSASSTPQPQPAAMSPPLPAQPQFAQQYAGGFNNGGGTPVPPAPKPQQHPPLKWANLPLSTQMKLGNMPQDQADLIAQVLSLPADQISSLPPDRQTMVASIRQQYL